MVLGVPLEAVSSRGSGLASFATGRGVVGGALGRASDADDSKGARVLAGLEKMDLGAAIIFRTQAQTEELRGQSPNLGKGETASLRWDSEPSVMLPASLCRPGPKRRCESPGRTRLRASDETAAARSPSSSRDSDSL